MNLPMSYIPMILSVVITNMYLFGCIQDLKLDLYLVCRTLSINIA